MNERKLPLPALPEEQVSEADWAEWKSHPVTKEVLRLLDRRREELKEHLASGFFTDPQSAGNALLYGKAIGECKALKDVLVLDHNEVNEGLRDDE